MAPPDAGYVSLADLAKYSGLSVRSLRRHIDGPPGEALPWYRDKIVVKLSEYDGGVQQFRSSRLPR